MTLELKSRSTREMAKAIEEEGEPEAAKMAAEVVAEVMEEAIKPNLPRVRILGPLNTVTKVNPIKRSMIGTKKA